MAKDKKTRVRKPVIEDESPPTDSDEEQPKVVTRTRMKPKAAKVPSPKVDDEPEPKKAAKYVVPTAQVVLTGSASLRKHGRKFIKDRPFQVVGDEAIRFFERDSRFHVSRG
jgi:hypothetical protein